jgi:Tfp pilus assembly protein FimT
MVVLGLLGIAAAASGPGLARLLRDTRTSAAVNDLLHTVAAARVAAASVAQRAVVCGSADGRQCSGSMDWSRGVISFVDADGRDPPAVDAGDRVLSAHGAYAQQQVTSNRAAIVFEPDARFATPATITLCDTTWAGTGRAVIVSRAGRARASDRDSSGGSITCPRR